MNSRSDIRTLYSKIESLEYRDLARGYKEMSSSVYLCWPIGNSALVIRIQMWGDRGGCGVSAQPMSTAVGITWHGAQINFRDLPPYLTYMDAAEWLEAERLTANSKVLGLIPASSDRGGRWSSVEYSRNKEIPLFKYQKEKNMWFWDRS
jgi:hypothetical protein